jgi:hypothetical protein
MERKMLRNKDDNLEETMERKMLRNKDDNLEETMERKMLRNKDDNLEETMERKMLRNKDDNLEETMEKKMLRNKDDNLEETMERKMLRNKDDNLEETMERKMLRNKDDNLEETMEEKLLRNKESNMRSNMGGVMGSNIGSNNIGNNLEKTLAEQDLDKEKINKRNIKEETLHNYVKPDLNKIIMDNTTPTSAGYTPLNINISYNSQNSTNELDNNRIFDPNKENFGISDKQQNQTNGQLKNKNMGNYNDDSRINNNKDWIYGSNAWTNSPDYYIPQKTAKPLNEVMNTKKSKENIVSPLMINTPWSEYKSGDSNPDPYNL